MCRSWKITIKFPGRRPIHIVQNVFGEAVENDVESKSKISIGSDVWVGTQCCVLSGVSIGHGAVIASNSVVAGDIPPYAIVGGSPAKVIKYRFKDDIIEHLLKLKWWEWEIEEIRHNKQFLTNYPNFDNIKGSFSNGL